MMIFRVLCGEWIEPLYDSMRATGPESFLFFITALVIGNFLVSHVTDLQVSDGFILHTDLLPKIISLKLLLHHSGFRKSQEVQEGSNQSYDASFAHVDSSNRIARNARNAVVTLSPEIWVPYLKIAWEGLP